MKKILLVFCFIPLFISFGLPDNISYMSGTSIDSGYISVNEGKLYYEVAGKGKNIVLVHDGLIDREIWDNQFLVFTKNYRVIRYDRRGYGKSSNPQSPFSNLEDLYQLFEQLKIDKAIVLGMSAGGGLSIDFTLKYPERVSALVLVGAVVSGMGYSNHMFTRGGHLDPSLSPYNDLSKWLTYFASEDPYEICSKNIEAKQKVLSLIRVNEAGVLGRMRFSSPPERPAAKYLSEIHVPVLILVGEFDIPDVHAHAGVIQFGIPNSIRKIIPNSGHLIPLEQPEIFNKTVLIFLNSQEFFELLNSEGVKAAADYFLHKRKSNGDITLFDETQLNSMGYGYLQDGKIKEAIELFKLNTIAYPDSWNVFDSLGEAYLKDGQKDLAVKNYKKSLKLNPNNKNAKEVLKNINETR